MRLRKWAKLSEKDWDSVLLGNGASIAIHEGFAYNSLLKSAEVAGAITARLRKVFKHFETEDFEFVLRMLWHTNSVNSALRVKDNATSKAYKDVRNALLNAVRNTHASYAVAAPHLKVAAEFLKQFPTIVSLNYDVLVYWAILAGNASMKAKWFKDCFINGSFVTDWEFLRAPLPPAGGSSLVYYPHGNLVLAHNLSGQEKKISNQRKELLDAIEQEWESDEYAPLFVSEGTADQKKQAIDRSPYLRAIYDDVLPNLGESVVIYGWSIPRQDQHILTKILKNTAVKRLAVSIYPDENINKSKNRIKRAIKKATKRNIAITFFDATSEGAWIYRS